MNKPLTCFFFIPGLSEKYRTGGLLVIQALAALFKEKLKYKCHFVTTHESHPDALSPEKAFTVAKKSSVPTCFIVTWGPLVEKHNTLIQKSLPDARILYYAQSFGWNIHVPKGISIICVSRFVMAQFALHSPEHFIGFIPPTLNPIFNIKKSQQKRDIDILIHKRKQNRYCLEKLLPALEREKLHIKIVEDWISQEEFAALLNRTKIFLYITALHKAGWFRRLPGEGFGLPALEAVACGAMVGSNLLGGVTDFLTPGENCIKLQTGNLQFDIQQIKKAVENSTHFKKNSFSFLDPYREPAIAKQWQNVLV